MASNVNDYRQLVRSALRHTPVVRSPECPEPEVMLDWIDQGDAYPAAIRLLDHLFACAYCRREYADLCRLRALRVASRPALPAALRSLPARVRTWVRELIAEGITTPLQSTHVALQCLTVEAARSATDPMGDDMTPFDLQPAGTAIRSRQPTLRWSSSNAAQTYEVVILPQTNRKRGQTVWKGSAGSELQLTLPEAAGLKPAGVYQWQVIAHTEGQRFVASAVGFVVMTDQARRRVEALEQEVRSSPLGLIGLYEAYGLYAEALQQAETLFQLNPEDADAAAIRTKLLQRLL